MLKKLTTSILKEAVSREYTDYAGSEQAAMALQTIIYNYLIEGLIDDPTDDSLEQGELSNLLAKVENPDTFNPDRAKESFKRLQARLAGK